MDYGDVTHDQSSNASFSSKIESVQHNATLAITSAIRYLSREKLYKEVELEYLDHRRWTRRSSLLYKVLSNKVPKCIYESIIPPIRHSFRNPYSITTFPYRNEYFKNYFFPCVTNDWNKLEPKIHNSTFYPSLRNPLINLIRPSKNKINNIHNEVGIKLLTRLGLGTLI